MAKVLKTFPVAVKKESPYLKFLDGRVWELEHKKDFHCTPTAARCYLYKVARLAGKKAQVTFRGLSRIIVQAS